MTATAQPVTDREQLIAQLEKSADRYLAVLTSVPESAAGVKLNDDSWSILQVAEHVAVVEHRMLAGLRVSAEKLTPPNLQIDERITASIPNRAAKLQAPPMVIPKGRWLTLADCAEAFRNSRRDTSEYVRTAENLRGKLLAHPVLGEIDGHQAIMVMAGHAERHTLQIEEIKNSESFRNAGH